MDTSKIILSKGQVYERLKRHLEMTIEYISMMRKRGEKVSIELPIGNWIVHAQVCDYPKVASYFTPELAFESAALCTEYDSILEKAEKNAYLKDPTVKERNFPWFDNLDLNQNLRKDRGP